MECRFNIRILHSIVFDYLYPGDKMVTMRRKNIALLIPLTLVLAGCNSAGEEEATLNKTPEAMKNREVVETILQDSSPDAQYRVKNTIVAELGSESAHIDYCTPDGCLVMARGCEPGVWVAMNDTGEIVSIEKMIVGE